MKRLLAVMVLCLLLVGCGRKTEQVPNEPVLVEAGVYTLSDGSVVDLWRTDIFEDLIYKSTDGIELLRVREPVDIANVHSGNMIEFSSLDETVQGKIRAYYDENWPELDIPALLENAWSAYHSDDPEKVFYGHFAEQSVFPAAFNESLVVYCVETVLPVESLAPGETVVKIEHVHTIFDRRTGDEIDFWDLFSVSREQAAGVMARKLALNDEQYPEIRAALMGEASVHMSQGSLGFVFPLGTLSWSEYEHHMSLNCGELRDILHDWAITEKSY